MTPLNLSGSRALVTAGAAGIGKAIALALNAAGAKVCVCDVDTAALAALATEHPALTQRHCDVADDTQVAQLVAFAVASLGGLDIVVCNAGIAGPTGPIESLDPEAWRRTLDVNLNGAYHTLRHAVPHLKANGDQGGSVVIISSAAGKLGFPLRTPYSAAKFALVGLTESLAMELGPDHIRVNAILPGVVAGERQDRVLSAKAAARGVSLAEQRALAVSRVSMRTMVEARDIASAVVFLCSDAGRYVSGEKLSVGGNVEGLS